MRKSMAEASELTKKVNTLFAYSLYYKCILHKRYETHWKWPVHDDPMLTESNTKSEEKPEARTRKSMKFRRSTTMRPF